MWHPTLVRRSIGWAPGAARRTLDVYEAIESNSLAIWAGATSTLHCCRKERNGCAIACRSAHSCGWVTKYARIEFSPSCGDSAPALVTTSFAPGWLARYPPVAEDTEPRALLSPAAVHSGAADAVGSAIVAAASPPSTPEASTPRAPRLNLMLDVPISHPLNCGTSCSADARGYPTDSTLKPNEFRQVLSIYCGPSQRTSSGVLSGRRPRQTRV